MMGSTKIKADNPCGIFTKPIFSFYPSLRWVNKKLHLVIILDRLKIRYASCACIIACRFAAYMLAHNARPASITSGIN